jgi:hypothetical protein
VVVILMVKRSEMAETVGAHREVKNAYKVFVEVCEGNRPFMRPRT